MSFTFAVLLAAAIQPDMIVSTDWLAEHLKDPNVIVLEVGDRPDSLTGDFYSWRAGHIPGAHFLPRSDILVSRSGVPDELPAVERLEQAFGRAGVGNEARIVIYSKDPLLATRTWFTLDYLGHGDRASILDGGIVKWRVEGRKVDEGKYASANAEFTAHADPGKLMTQADVRTAIQTGSYRGKSVVVLDARPPLQYMGVKKGRAVSTAGHIPDSHCFPWTAHLTTDIPRVLKNDRALEEMYASVGATEGVRVIVYCRTGVEASMNYFVLRHLGYDVVLYDGSYVEWNRSVDAPIATAMK